MRAFEITGAGFDGSTDSTDDRVLVIAADSEQVVHDAIAGLGARYWGLVPDASAIDYTLPRDAVALRTKLQQWHR